jgi:type III secretion protein U
VDIVVQTADRPFAETWGWAVSVAIGIIVRASLPLVAVIVVTDLVSGHGGDIQPGVFVRSRQARFDHINPAQGLKRIASLRTVVEFAKAAIKVVVLLAAFCLVLRGAIKPLFDVPCCGQTCLAETTLAALWPLAAAAVVAFVAIGRLDLLVQRQLFLRDMRMTRTEFKREVKDLEGDPLIRGERRRMRTQLAAQWVRVGLRQAVIAVIHRDHIVGLRYRPDDTPIPVVVCKGSGAAGKRMIGEAR